MRIAERATQIWSLLTFAAHNNQILTYDLVARLIGVPRPALGQLLEPIQSLCLTRGYPPLSILVVSAESGEPGSGFIATDRIPSAQQDVFRFRWLDERCPTPADFEAAVRALPSNGVRDPVEHP
jgi:hypothetical protein